MQRSNKRVLAFAAAASCWAFFVAPVSHGAVKLDSLGRYLTHHGYGGAQLIDTGKFYHLPIRSNGRPGHLVIDTGSPTTLIFRSSVRPLGLNETRTNAYVRGAFGTGTDRYGLAVIASFSAGNYTVINIPVGIAPDVDIMRAYGKPNGLLGLRELRKFGAVIDFAHRMLYLRPTAPNIDITNNVRLMLQSGGWHPVHFTFSRNHLRIPGEVNDLSCHFLLDTGAFLTALDRGFANANRITIRPTHATAHGVGKSTGSVGLATLRSLAIGDFEIPNASASVLNLDQMVLGRGTMGNVVGMIGVEYLALNSAIFDFMSETLYLRPHVYHQSRRFHRHH